MKALSELLAEQGRVMDVPAKTTIFRCGDTAASLYYVVSGELQALRHLPDGRQAVMMRANDGEFFAAASINLDCYPCDAFAPVDTRLITLAMSRFLSLLEADATVAAGFARALALNLKHQCGRLERMRLTSAKDRVLHYIACESRDGRSLELPFPLVHWASELGIEPESLYRTLSQLEKAGIIRRDKTSIELRSPAGEHQG